MSNGGARDERASASLLAEAMRRARRAKHRVHVIRLSVRKVLANAYARVRDCYFLRTSSAPFHFDPRRYRHTFLAAGSRALEPRGSMWPPGRAVPPVRRVIYCFWTGSNPLTPRRLQSLSEMRVVNEGIDVVLVTPDNLPEFVLPDAPLHPAYGYLSAVHKSDYLRAYFMHHHGGGYSDVKKPLRSWRAAFARLGASSVHWSIGYREVAASAVPQLPGRLGWDLKSQYTRIHGVCAFIMRPDTALTREWLYEVDRRVASPIVV